MKYYFLFLTFIVCNLSLEACVVYDKLTGTYTVDKYGSDEFAPDASFNKNPLEMKKSSSKSSIGYSMSNGGTQNVPTRSFQNGPIASFR